MLRENEIIVGPTAMTAPAGYRLLRDEDRIAIQIWLCHIETAMEQIRKLVNK